MVALLVVVVLEDGAGVVVDVVDAASGIIELLLKVARVAFSESELPGRWGKSERTHWINVFCDCFSSGLAAVWFVARSWLADWLGPQLKARQISRHNQARFISLDFLRLSPQRHHRFTRVALGELIAQPLGQHLKAAFHPKKSGSGRWHVHFANPIRTERNTGILYKFILANIEAF